MCGGLGQIEDFIDLGGAKRFWRCRHGVENIEHPFNGGTALAFHISKFSSFLTIICNAREPLFPALQAYLILKKSRKREN